MPDNQNDENNEQQTVSMTQEALNALISTRLERQKATILDQYKDYDTIKAEAETLRKSVESETERKVREAVETAKSEATIQATTKNEAQISNARTRVLELTIKTEAAVLGFAHIEDVIEKLRASTDIEITEDFEVKGVDKAVKKLAEERPSWLTGNTSSNSGGNFTPKRPKESGGSDNDSFDPETRKFEERKRLLGNMGYMTKL